MYICICQGVTERDIHQAVGQGICSLESLSESMGVSRDCGACSGHACQVLEKAIASKPSGVCATGVGALSPS